MLHRHVFILQGAGTLLGLHHKAGEPGGDIDLAWLDPWAGDPHPSGKFSFEAGDEVRRVFSHAGEKPRYETVLLSDKGEEKMLAVYLRVAVGYGDILGFREGLPRFCRKFCRIHEDRSFPVVFIKDADPKIALPAAVFLSGSTRDYSIRSFIFPSFALLSIIYLSHGDYRKFQVICRFTVFLQHFEALTKYLFHLLRLEIE